MADIQRCEEHYRVDSYSDYLYKLDYWQYPVDIITFITSDYFLGKSTNNGNLVYPVWKEALKQIFGDDSKVLVVLTGAIGTGKSTISVIALAYIMYRLLCLHNPWGYFKLTSSGQMGICFFNLTKSLGDSRGYGKLQSFLSNSPWFLDRQKSLVKDNEKTIVTFPLFNYLLASPYSKGFGCLGPDVKVPLLDGRCLTIPEIIEERKVNDNLYVYSYDIEKHKLVSGKIASAVKTKVNTKVVKVTLDNGCCVVCTPDHPFLTKDGEYKEAQNLCFGDSLEPLYRRLDEYGYEQFYQPSSDTWLYTHRRMAGDLPKDCRDSKGRFVKDVLVHHIDFNKRNNNPTNLQYMTGIAHRILHNQNVGKTWHTKEARQKASKTRAITFQLPEIKRKISEGIKRSWTQVRREQQRRRRQLFNKTKLRDHNNQLDVKLESNRKRKLTIYKFWSSGIGQLRKRILSDKLKHRNQLGQAKRASLVGNSEECRRKAVERRKRWLVSPEGLAWRKEQSTRMKTNNANNHKVVSVIECNSCDVYDLTVDQFHNFAVDGGVFVHNTVGEDVVAGMMDEVDSPTESEKQKVRVLKAYEATVRRFESRFVVDGQTLGRLFLVASKQDEMSFIDTFVTKMKTSGKVLVFDIPLWEAKPKTYFSGVTFKVAVGDAYHQPKMISAEEEDKYKSDGYRIINVPEEFKEEFGRDLIGALRDLAGITVAGMRKSKLFASEKFIINCFDESKSDPVSLPTVHIGLSDEADLMMYLDLSKIRLPKSTPRYIHLDIAFSNDAIGLSMCGIKEWTEGNIENPDGTFRKERLPIVETDFILRIEAREGDRIPIHKVRKFILDLRARGYNVKKFTSDLRLASEDTLQILNKAGIVAGYLSLDKTDEPYVNFRNLVYEKRWVCHKHARTLFELKHLERDPEKGKIDHPKEVAEVEFLSDGSIQEVVMEGSKDCSDSVVGAITTCLTDMDIPMDTSAMKQVMSKLSGQQANDSMGILMKDREGKSIVGVKAGDSVQKLSTIFKKLSR